VHIFVEFFRNQIRKGRKAEFSMSSSWAITPEKVDTALNKIIEISKPRKVILFGSYVRGEIHSNSDLDILVVLG